MIRPELPASSFISNVLKRCDFSERAVADSLMFLLVGHICAKDFKFDMFLLKESKIESIKYFDDLLLRCRKTLTCSSSSIYASVVSFNIDIQSSKGLGVPRSFSPSAMFQELPMCLLQTT